MQLVEYLPALGFLGLIFAIGAVLTGGTYLALRKRPVEIGVLVFVIMLFVIFFIWVLIENHGVGAHNPMTAVAILLALVSICIIAGILLSLLAQFVRRRKRDQ